MPQWSNWSGLVTSSPRRLVEPSTEAEVASLVRDAASEGLGVRVAGAGHSFSALVATDDVIASLGALSGITDVDVEGRQVEMLAGTPIHATGPLLAEHGLALVNQGDIDRQALGGACGTGTHGTGAAFTSFSGAVTGATVILSSGDAVRCDADTESDLFRASQLSLGGVGVVTRLRLVVRDAFNLHELEWSEPLDECMDRLDEHIAATRHFEFWWFPGIDKSWCKSLDEVTEEPASVAGSEHERFGPSWEIFPSARDDRFNEMEYAVPAERGPECFMALRDLFVNGGSGVTWPIEYRTQAADDVWMSTANGRPTVTLSIHEPIDRDHEPLFRAAEEIFVAHDGRPHWGKLSYLDAATRAELAPGWDQWWAVRDAADPAGMFLNAHLRYLRG
jgi:FAD/FMN-containing dehydrogenase